MPFLGVRVHPAQAKLLANLAAAGVPRSRVVREALDAYFADLEEVLEPADRAARLATASRQAQVEEVARLFTTEEADQPPS